MPRSTSTPPDRPASHHGSPPAERTLPLRCPECSAAVSVAAGELIEGATVPCAHCACRPQLTHEFDEITGRTRWLLADPRDDYAEDAAP